MPTSSTSPAASSGSPGSTYRVNGKEVRARDVQLLFADAATGARSPAMVRQGRSARSSPPSRRPAARILEDAAGIAGLHSRRHEAELRLTAAEDNIDPPRRRARSSSTRRSTASSARRGRPRATARWRPTSARPRRCCFSSAGARRATACWRPSARSNADLGEVADRTKAQAEAATRQAVAAHALPALRDAEAAAAAALQRLTLARDLLEAEEKRARERALELERRSVELARDIQRESTLIEDAGGALGRLSGEEEQLLVDGEAARIADAEAREKLTGLETALAASEAALGEAQAAVADLNARRAAVDRAIREETDRSNRLSADLERVQRDLAAIETALGADADVSGLRAEIEAGSAAAAAADEQAQSARTAHAAARGRRGAAARSRHGGGPHRPAARNRSADVGQASRQPLGRQMAPPFSTP